MNSSVKYTAANDLWALSCRDVFVSDMTLDT